MEIYMNFLKVKFSRNTPQSIASSVKFVLPYFFHSTNVKKYGIII